MIIKLLKVMGFTVALCCSVQGAEFNNPPKPQKSVESQLAAAGKLIRRLLPKHAGQIKVEALDSGSAGDRFEIESVAGKIVLRGNSGVAIASALNWYLKYTCNCQVAWSGSQLNLPEKLPAVKEKISLRSPYKFRNYLNYCTFSYTMAWWDWERWEREIDWMALNGISMPLMVVGQEATWLATFKRYGVTDKEMQEFFTGPAYFAWHWMTNIDSVGGPLPMSWIESHRKLAQKILKRERELGMTPILQGFSGHVPKAFLDKHPQVRFQREKGWGYVFPGTYQMDPLDPFFPELGKAFIEEQTRLFGSDHLYAADPFHEGHPPVEGDKYLNDVGKAIFNTMTGVDKDAIWVKQSWSFREAILAPIPKERFIILDLNGGGTWNKKNPFNGRPTAWGTLYNLGGRRYMTGSIKGLLGRCGQLKNQAKNVVGFGSFDECIEWNPVIFDALYENAWRESAPDVEEWVHEYATRRYGKKCVEFDEAWSLLLKNVYNGGRWYGSTLSAKPCLSLNSDSPCGGGCSFPGDNRELIKAWKLLLSQSDDCGNAPGYRYDIVDLGNQILNNYAASVHQRLIRAFKAGNRAEFEQECKEFRELLDDVEELTGTHEMFMLGKWIKDARSWGTTEAEKDLYEYNARSLISLWSEEHPRISDYATRGWNGMYSGYYGKRWGMFLDMLKDKFAKGEFDYTDRKCKRVFGRPSFEPVEPFYIKMLAFEKKWCKSHEKYPSKPTGDTVSVAKRLEKKYYPKVIKSYELAAAGKYPVNMSYRYVKPKVTVKKKTNITSGKPVTVIGRTQNSRCRPELAVDGIVDKASHWSANSNSKGECMLQVDLGKNTMINGATVWTYWDNKRYYQYNLSVSTDGLEWQKVVDFSKNTKPAGSRGYRHKFPKVSARYIRIEFLKNSANPAFHLVEFHVNVTN